MEDQELINQALRDFLATSNSGKYNDENVLFSKFPELNEFDKQSLRDFVATSNSGKYKTEEEIFSKFPEFKVVKKKEPTTPLSFGYKTATEATSSVGLPKQEKLSQSPLKTAGTTTPSVSTKQPKQNIDYLTDINNLYKEKVAASQGRLSLKKQLVDLKPQIDSAYADIEQLTALYNDVNLPLQERNAAAKQANDLRVQITPMRQKYDEISGDYNNLVAKDKDVLARLKQVDAERQKALDKDFSIGKDFVEKTGKGFVDAAAGIAGIFNTLGLSGDPESPETREEVKQQTRQNIDKIREFGNKLVTQEAPKEFEKAFEGKMTPKKLLYLTSSAVAQTVPTVAAGLFTGGAGTALIGAGMGFNESKDIFKQAGLNDSQSEWAALGLSVPLGLLESYGVDDVVRVIGSPIIKKKVAADLAKSLVGKQLTKKLLFDETRKSLGKVIAQNAGGILTTGFKEGSTEVFQGALQEVAKQTAQEYTGVNPDDEMPFDEYIKGVGMELAEQGAGGVLGGTSLQTGGQLISGAARGFKADFTPSVYSQVKEFEDPEKFAEFEQDLQEDIANGLLTPEQAEEAMQNAMAIKEADAKIPSTIVDNDKRTKAVNLIIEKNGIQKETEGKDKSLVVPQMERLKEIDNELTTISKEETTADEQRGIEEPISAGTDVVEEGLGMATEPSKEGIAGENIQAEKVLVPRNFKEEKITEAIDNERQYLEKEILSEEQYIAERKNKKSTFRKVFDKLSGVTYDKYLKAQQNRLSLLNENPLAYFEKELADEKKWQEKHPEDANENIINYLTEVVDNFKSREQAEAVPQTPLEEQQAPEVISETVSEIEPPVVEQTTADVGGGTTPNVSEALKDVESTANFIKSITDNNLIDILIKSGDIQFLDENGKPCASKGISTLFEKGGKWEVVTDFKNTPTHSKGGRDIDINGTKVEVEKNELRIENEFGDVAVIPSEYRDKIKKAISSNCHTCVDSIVSSLPKMKNYAGDGTIFPFFGRYKIFKNTLPNNLKNTPENEYAMRYYWRHSNKPTDFNAALAMEQPMFTLEQDGFYHAPSVEPNTLRFLKPKTHPTIQYELDWYNSSDPNAIDFRNKYSLDMSGKYYKYIPKQ